MSFRRLPLTGLILLGMLAGMALVSAPALAAEPPRPSEKVVARGITTTRATLTGVLVGVDGKATLGWHFAYNTGGTCMGGSTTPEGSIEFEGGEYESAEVTGLAPSTQYTFCLVAKSSSGEETIGPEVTFETIPVSPTTHSPLLRLGPFEYVSGVAVDQANGNVFVVDTGENVIEHHEAGDLGVHVYGAEGGSPVDGFPSKLAFISYPSNIEQARGIAVYDSDGSFNLYLTDPVRNVVDKYTLNAAHEYELVCELVGPGARCVKSESELKAGEPTQRFLDPDAVAVDAQGNVYVATSGPAGGGVDKFNGAGEYAWALSHAQAPGIQAPVGVAADTKGDVYLVNIIGDTVKLEVGPEGALHHEEVFYAAGKGVFNGSSDVTESEYYTTAVAVEQSSGNVFLHRISKVAGPGSLVLERSVLSSSLAEFEVPAPEGTFHINQERRIESGVAVREDEAANDVYVSYREDVNFRNGYLSADYVEMFGPAPPTLRVTTRAPSEAQGTSATVNGTVNPKGVPVKSCAFEWGATTAYGRTPLACSPEASKLGSGKSEVPVSAVLTGLAPNTVYHYQLLAESENGHSSQGGDGTVVVPVRPRVDDLPPSATATRTTVQFSGAVNPENSTTTYHYVYVDAAAYAPGAASPYAAGGSTISMRLGHGPEEVFGGVIPEEIAPFPEGINTTASVAVTGLTAGTTYDYALVASNAAGASVGENHVFTTAAATPPLVGTGAASELTPTTATIAGTVNPQGLQTSYEFDLGTDTGYGGARVFASAGESAGVATETLSLSDLVPGTTYHYRIAATNEDGTSYGADQSFTTPGVPSPISQPLTEPLIAAPAIAFPTETGPVVKPPLKKKAKAKIKKKRKKKRKQAKKASRDRGAKQ